MPSTSTRATTTKARNIQTGRFRRDPATSRPTSGPARFQARNPRDNVADRDPLVAQAVARAKAGDREAIAFLYTRYSDSVYGYVQSIVTDEHAAEDVTQQVFMKLMTVLDRYEPRKVPFAAWIVRVARNAAFDSLRDRRSIPCEEVYGTDHSTDESRLDCRRTLQQALESLPEDQRNVIVLRHLYGYSPGEIADRLGKTAPSIHGLHHRGRQALRAELRRLESAPATL